MIQITQPQARHLAAFLAAIRPDWNRHGIESALADARQLGTPARLAVAAIEASQDMSNRTPAVIALDGPHWHTPSRLPGPRFPEPHDGARCSVCFRPQGTCDARRRTDPDPHPFLSVADAKAQAVTREQHEAAAQPEE